MLLHAAQCLNPLPSVASVTAAANRHRAMPDNAPAANVSLDSSLSSAERISPLHEISNTPPPIPDHELLRRIGVGSYGEVWLARTALGEFRAVKIVHRKTFDHEKPYEREFNGLKKFEPISHARESQID